MTQPQRLDYLIDALMRELPDFYRASIPTDMAAKKKLFRALCNVRLPLPVRAEFLQIQDAYLTQELSGKNITDVNDLAPVQDQIYLWQGDITTLRVDAIVNAANSRLLGCFAPCHACIDNAIHTFAGVQLRLACNELMEKQGVPEESGRAKLTSAFNLPSRYVLHTVGPIISGRVTHEDRALLASCYRSCLELARQNRLRSIAFCCISTGEFHFPNDLAAEIAVETVKNSLHKSPDMQVVFNVYKDLDSEIYKKILRKDG